MERKIVKTSNAEIWIDEQGIYHQIYTAGAKVTIEDTREEFRIISEISGYKKVPILVNINYVKHVPRESRIFFTGKEGDKMWLGQNVQLIKNAGRIVRFQSIARDITKRKQAEEVSHEA